MCNQTRCVFLTALPIHPRFSRILLVSNIKFPCLSNFAGQTNCISFENTVICISLRFEKHSYHVLSIISKWIEVTFRLHNIKAKQFFNQATLWCRKSFHYTHYLSHSENYADIPVLNIFPVSRPSIKPSCQASEGSHMHTSSSEMCSLSWFIGILQDSWQRNILAFIKKL